MTMASRTFRRTEHLPPKAMLSVERVRELLGRPELTDAEAEEVREDLYCFARVLIEAYLRERRGQAPPQPQ